jgi:hypothetical protein
MEKPSTSADTTVELSPSPVSQLRYSKKHCIFSYPLALAEAFTIYIVNHITKKSGKGRDKTTEKRDKVFQQRMK